MASDWMISTMSASTATGPSSVAGLRPPQSRHVLRVTNPNRRLVDVENVLTHNIGIGAIRGSVSGRNERPQPQFGHTLHRPDLGRPLWAAPERSDLEPALIQCRAGHGGLVLGRRGGGAGKIRLVGEVLTGWDCCSTTRRE